MTVALFKAGLGKVLMDGYRSIHIKRAEAKKVRQACKGENILSNEEIHGTIYVF